ncbi:BTAD domain-containing putative transcriptional regulator [Rhodococcoides yunnanense]|uniref:BTAD domain-containing putative transcriptional regulator n=1 Tax=Rhodococcoides yunnanense TaxID=278209 RepID=UPI0009343BCD|nr:BTAD domain-containing putative transcriptional regulator [Rhodococcus yunnanensis]
MQVTVLGATSAQSPSGPIDLGGPRQRGVLAILLIARGDVVSVDRLTDDLWNGEPPARATGALQAYISNLRRVLEPDRAPRTPSSILVSKAPGYAVRLPVESVDAWHFESLVRQAAADTDATGRRRLLDEALRLWRGDAYGEVSSAPWAQAEIARLNELRTVARERLVGATLDCGHASDAVLDATTLTREHPLREESWRLLALALYSSGRQADALTALRRARTTLGDELGLDPGPALVELEAAVLSHRVALPRPAPVVEQHTPAAAVTNFVGRADELRSLTDPASSIVLVAGEAGSGKTALLAASIGLLESDGWTCLLGRCPEADGAPPAWAWTEILRAATSRVAPSCHADALAPLLGDAPATAPGSRFLVQRAVVEYLSGVAALGPVAIVLDDLHRADPETLALLVAIAHESSRSLRILGGYRPDEIDAPQRDALAALAPLSPTRLRLTGLTDDEAAELVQSVSGLVPEPSTMLTLTERTAGNPFYLRESALLLSSEGAVVAESEVPEGVRDVLRRRFARLPELTVSMLRLASVFGRDADLDVLLAAAELDSEHALDALESGVVAGLLDDTDPTRIRFTHVLVRDTLYSDLTLLRRRRWHARIAEVLEHRSPQDFPALAFHYAQLSGPTHIRKTLDYAAAAAAEADARFAHGSAAVLYAAALDAWRRLPDGSVEEQIELLSQRISAQVAGGASIGAARTRREAVSIAEGTGRTDLLIRTLTAGELPTTWLKREYGEYDAGVVALIERALTREDIDDASRCRLLCALVDEIRGELDDRAMEAAEHAHTVARTLADPEILGLASNALWNLIPPDLDPTRRMQLSLDLIELGTTHDMPVFAMIGHHGAFLVDAAERRFDRMREHLENESSLAERYSWQQTLATCHLSRGMLAHAAGDIDAAHRHFDSGGAALRSSVAVNAETIHSLAYVTTAVTTGHLVALEPGLRRLYSAYPAIACDLLALTLVETGKTDEARRVRRSAGPIRHDFFESLFLALRGMAVLATGELNEAPEVYSSLSRFSGQLAGMGTGTYVIGPVDTVLARLAAALGDTDSAAEHQLEAIALARAWGSPYWIAAATRKPQEHSK